MANTVTVKKGDTLSAIAAKVGVSLKELLALNPQIKNANLINPGQVITVTKPEVSTPAAPKPAPAGNNDAQNAARLIAEDKAKAEALSPSGIRTALDKINADEAAKAYALGEPGRNDKAAAAAKLVTPPAETPKQPGKAWVWDGSKWAKPPMPSDGQSYIWDDNNGYTGATTASVAKGQDVIPPRPGEAYVWNATTKTWDRPTKPAGNGYSWDDNDGWISTTLIPGSTGTTVTAPERTLAVDTFKNTLALVFGAKEANQPYVAKLYELVSGFYKTGSTQDEALNLAIREAYNNNAIPEFTKRFAGIFALDAKLRAGEAIQVPTIAEFFAAEAKMGDVLKTAGLGDLANQDFLGNVIGLGKSVSEVSDLISTAFNTIDNAPEALKKTLQEYYPAASRSDLAKAMLMGPEGAKALEKKIAGISVLSAAQTQGVTTDLTQASDIAAMGYGYGQALTGFGEVKGLQRAGELAKIGGTDFTQQQAQNAVFGKNAADLAEIARLKQLEENRFSGRTGSIGPKAFASQARANTY
jgi:hypothetical protein